MRLFLDTAKLEEVRKTVKLGIISGVTTNPSLVSQEDRSFHDLVAEICDLVDGPVSAEVMATEASAMVAEARELTAIHPNVVIKIPIMAEGLKAVNLLRREGIKTNVTLVFSVNQALGAALAGAKYVSPFVGRLDDIGQDGISLVADICRIFSQHGLETEVIAASIRNPLHITQAARAGANIATVPYSVMLRMLEHPLTQIGITRFQTDWEKKQN